LDLGKEDTVKRLVGYSIMATLIAALIIVLVPQARADLSFKWTIVATIYEPAEFVAAKPLYELWDDADWIVVAQTCDTLIGCRQVQRRIFYPRATWKKLDLGDWCRDVNFGSSYVPCKNWWGWGTTRDPLVARPASV
jgi:hypothetical protein